MLDGAQRAAERIITLIPQADLHAVHSIIAAEIDAALNDAADRLTARGVSDRAPRGHVRAVAPAQTMRTARSTPSIGRWSVVNRGRVRRSQAKTMARLLDVTWRSAMANLIGADIVRACRLLALSLVVIRIRGFG